MLTIATPYQVRGDDRLVVTQSNTSRHCGLDPQSHKPDKDALTIATPYQVRGDDRLLADTNKEFYRPVHSEKLFSTSPTERAEIWFVLQGKVNITPSQPSPSREGVAHVRNEVLYAKH